METKIKNLDVDNIDRKFIKQAVDILQTGGTVVFPTETVYGLGANGLDSEAVKKIFQAKGRPSDNPLILHVHSIEQVEELVEHIPHIARLCMEKFWPGPLTIIFKKSSRVPYIITAGLDTVAIRMPRNNIALEIIKEANIPIAAPSANLSGRPSPTTAKHVIDDLVGKVDMIIDGGSTGVGIESTVLDLSGDIPMILRPGAVTKEDLKEIIFNIEVDSSIISSDENIIPKSPGQKYKHYAPNAEMIVFTGEINNIINTINKEIIEYRKKGKKTGIMCTDETKDYYKDVLSLSLGSRKRPETISHNLFNILRIMDEENVDIILAEGIEISNIGLAIMNRMMKASSGRVIRT